MKTEFLQLPRKPWIPKPPRRRMDRLDAFVLGWISACTFILAYQLIRLFLTR